LPEGIVWVAATIDPTEGRDEFVNQLSVLHVERACQGVCAAPFRQIHLAQPRLVLTRVAVTDIADRITSPESTVTEPKSTQGEDTDDAGGSRRRAAAELCICAEEGGGIRTAWEESIPTASGIGAEAAALLEAFGVSPDCASSIMRSKRTRTVTP
jgi:hypothetical protein